jgi:phosphatidylinositol alpha 1,6-mannosyltransferase
LAPILAKLRPDVVHVHLGLVSPFAWGGIRAAVQVGVPVLATVHSVWGAGARSGYGAANTLFHWGRAGVQPAAVSRVAADRIAAILPGGTPVLITPNGVDPVQWSPAGRRAPEPGSPVVFVAAMRLAPRKRAAELLDMFAGAQAKCAAVQPIRLLIAGDGPHRSRLAAQVRERGLSADVEFLGRMPRPELRALYLESDVFVQPSVKESFGLAALEARTTGLPVIARSQTGLTEFIHDGVQGLLCADDEAMAQAMARIALDASLRRRITDHNVGHEPEQVWSRVLPGLHASYGAARRRAGR